MSRKASIKPHRASQSKELTTIKERARFTEELKTQENSELKALRTQLEQAQAQSAQLAAEAKREQQQKEEAIRQAEAASAAAVAAAAKDAAAQKQLDALGKEVAEHKRKVRAQCAGARQ